MVYEFAKYPDETLVVFSDIRKKENGDEYIRVSFESSDLSSGNMIYPSFISIPAITSLGFTLLVVEEP